MLIGDFASRTTPACPTEPGVQVRSKLARSVKQKQLQAQAQALACERCGCGFGRRCRCRCRCSCAVNYQSSIVNVRGWQAWLSGGFFSLSHFRVFGVCFVFVPESRLTLTNCRMLSWPKSCRSVAVKVVRVFQHSLCQASASVCLGDVGFLSVICCFSPPLSCPVVISRAARLSFSCFGIASPPVSPSRAFRLRRFGSGSVSGARCV